MPHLTPKPLRVAAISFLNPAPLMWDFEHPPLAPDLATRFTLHYTQPSTCAHELLEGRADLGLIPIAALNSSLAIVPGCAIASLDEVRSILLLVRRPHTLSSIRTLAADTASRSSIAYAQLLLHHFHGNHPTLLPNAADPVAMLAHADAALLIGDPALLARQRQSEIEAVVGPCAWLDLAHEWHSLTGLPWVAAVWAARPEAVAPEARPQLIADLQRSRDNGLAHIDDLVAEWTPRIPLPPEVIRTYLTRNIHYRLDDACIQAIHLFRRLAAEAAILPPLPSPLFL